MTVKGAIKSEVAKNFMCLRKKNNLTQKALADKLGVKNNTISQWENGTNAIDVEMLCRACDIFNVSISDIFGPFGKNRRDDLTYEEMVMILHCRSLNAPGKKRVYDYIDDLMVSGKYTCNAPANHSTACENKRPDISSTKNHAAPYTAAGGDTSNLKEAQHIYDQSIGVDACSQQHMQLPSDMQT